ncbi:uncharacterized protein EDB93DRAFT_1102431 [Suillus bovinus]|uniref:uncharacterized protein n=1 Tax=Suillus bovinus TaxID=48563 RepID=UPI001B86C577|nr:uncharacterized protein EDB93DRAFT_1102431 [Suillus bovinus]KAG2154301.1 hypothetical protein EDB93DRAFT_1102431 [Suillus bovinus]
MSVPAFEYQVRTISLDDTQAPTHSARGSGVSVVVRSYKRPALGWSTTEDIINFTLGNAKKNSLLQKEPTSQKGTEKQRNATEDIIDLTLGNTKKNDLLQKEPTSQKGTEKQRNTQILSMFIKANSEIDIRTLTLVVGFRELGVGNGDLELRIQYSEHEHRYSMLRPRHSLFGAR